MSLLKPEPDHEPECAGAVGADVRDHMQIVMDTRSYACAPAGKGVVKGIAVCAPLLNRTVVESVVELSRETPATISIVGFS